MHDIYLTDPFGLGRIRQALLCCSSFHIISGNCRVNNNKGLVNIINEIPVTHSCQRFVSSGTVIAVLWGKNWRQYTKQCFLDQNFNTSMLIFFCCIQKQTFPKQQHFLMFPQKLSSIVSFRFTEQWCLFRPIQTLEDRFCVGQYAIINRTIQLVLKVKKILGIC